MSETSSRNPPRREAAHEALAVFLGEWRAEGRSYGATGQPKGAPCVKPMPWKSTHTGRWHSGEFFLIQDERAVTGTAPFDTLSIMGWDAENGRYFARTFENHGFERRYDVTVDGRVWTFSGRQRTRPHRLQRRWRDADDHVGMAAGRGSGCRSATGSRCRSARAVNATSRSVNRP